MITLRPTTLKSLKRFKEIKRAYVSFILISFLAFVCVAAELVASKRALFVYHQGSIYLPTYGDIIPGTTFGLPYEYETNYRELKKLNKEETFVLLPLIPYGPYENDLQEGVYPPTPPDLLTSHYLGTDKTGRDIASRLIYGMRMAFAFSGLLLLFNYIIGITIGCFMGLWGGKFDLFFQRVIEIWSNIPFLYVVIIVAGLFTPNFITLTGIMLFFGWMGMTWQMRTSAYKQKARVFVMAADSMGASDKRKIFKHIIPNSLSIIVTFIPFSFSGGISSLTSLDYLGFGLPVPTPSWGELLKQGTDYLDSPWILLSVLTLMSLVLIMITFIGEGIREAFDPKKHTFYR